MRRAERELSKLSGDELRARLEKAGRDAAVLVFTVVGSGYFIIAPSSVEALPVSLRAYGPMVLWFNVVVGSLGLAFVALHVAALRKRLRAVSCPR